MKVSDLMSKVLLCAPVVFALFAQSALASIAPETQLEIQKRVEAGDYQPLKSISISEKGVTSKLLESNVDVSEMVKLIKKGDTAVLNDPSLSYRPQLAHMCRYNPVGAEKEACDRIYEQRRRQADPEFYYSRRWRGKSFVDYQMQKNQRACGSKRVYYFAATGGFTCVD